MQFFCKYCGQEIDKRKKFCSRDCYYKSRKGVKRPEHGRKLSKKMKSQGLSYKGTERAENISKARKKERFTKDQLNRLIKGIEDYYYVTNPKVLLNHLNMQDELRWGLQHDDVINLIRQYNTFFESGGFFPINVQKFDLNKMRGILLDSQRIPWDKLINKYGITKSQYMNILKKHGVQNYVHKEQDFSIQTNPEKEVEGILLDLNISYLRERYIKHKTFRCDFIVDSQIIVEVQGDYWHGNHRLFNKEDLNNIQKDKIERDKKKFEFAYEKGYTVIEIWEMDIYNKYKLVYNALKQILKEREINGTKHFSSEFF